MRKDPDEPHILPAAAPRAIEWAVETLVEGGVIAIPTDTVYGLAASIFSAPALSRIYEIKGRPRDKSLPVLVSSVESLEHVTEQVELTVGVGRGRVRCAARCRHRGGVRRKNRR